MHAGGQRFNPVRLHHFGGTSFVLFTSRFLVVVVTSISDGYNPSIILGWSVKLLLFYNRIGTEKNVRRKISY